MIYFLERIAKHLYEQTKGELRHHCIVFPNRRAGLYFLKYLGAVIERPVWTPTVMTINEFFASLSDLHTVESEVLLCELYKVYRKLNTSAESFDEFYFWGDMLINDFDDVDKYMADAAILFRNVQDFKNIDIQFGDIDREQAELIKRFWRNFEPEKPTPEKSEFKSVWSLLTDLYREFRASLQGIKIAYEGMIFRDVASRAISDENFNIKWDTVHFIGFNALNRCEETIMKHLQKTGQGKFYWDYDNSYIKGGKLNSAGLFLGRNLGLFKNDMPGDWKYDTLLSINDAKAKINIIETTSDIAQVKLIPRLISELGGISPDNAHHSAVILADENLLVPVLTSLPENAGDINISMGYPLKMTAVYALIRYLLNLIRNKTIENGETYFSYRDVLDILRHQLIVPLLSEEDKRVINDITDKNLVRVPASFLNRSEKLRKIFWTDNAPVKLPDHLRELLVSASSAEVNGDNASEEPVMRKKLENEFIYRVWLSINRLDTIVSSSEIILKTETYCRILDKILRSQSVPFSGEPLSGIQILGILETRCLDFENIIMLSVNEGILPSVTSASSFIPFSIREAFGLPTINHQESIFSYHFYRLLHRAKKVTLIYNSNSEGLRTGEMSRFIIQMKYEQVIKPEIQNLNFDIIPPISIGQIVERNDDHTAKLYSLYESGKGNHVLTPTAINTWLSCRMKFYYRYVNRLKEPETIKDKIDHALFGRILHTTMVKVYEAYKGKEILPELYDSLINDDTYLNELIDKAFTEENKSEIKQIHNGDQIIIRDILHIYLLRILKADRSIAPFTISGIEKSLIFQFNFSSGNKNITVRTGGIADRIDNQKGKIRIVDYKTGQSVQRINSIGDLFTEDRKRELDGWLQTLLYCEAFVSDNPDVRIQPSIYKIKELSDSNFNDTLRIKTVGNQELLLEDYNEIRRDFLNGLRTTLEIIFNPDEPFRMTEVVQKCNYCAYRVLCQR